MQPSQYDSLTNDELVRLPLVENDMDPLARVALDRLTAALEEIDILTGELDMERPCGPNT